MKSILSLTHDNVLKIDLYELTMAAGYFQNHVNALATFELSCHTIPPERSFLICCGLQQIIEYILNLRFSDEDIAFLKELPAFRFVQPDFFDYLKRFQFTGDVWAMPEGEIFFAKEPVIQVAAPLIEAQILETYLLSIMNIESLVATKAARVVHAAGVDGMKRLVVDFGTRRAHGPEAGILAARAAYISGCMGTSNVYAGRRFGIPIFGTMAHSWVESFDREEESFQKYYEVFPQSTVLLIDTYDTLDGAKKAARLNQDIKGVRIDSGNLMRLSRQVRRILDQHHRPEVKIIVSGNLNEYKIYDLVQARAPIDMFGVGTEMVVSRDHPALDLTYKLVQIEKTGYKVQYKAKHSQGKKTIPARKQVYRSFTKEGKMRQDTLSLFSETPLKDAQPLLHPVLAQGKLVAELPALKDIRAFALERLRTLPEACLELKSSQPLKVRLSDRLLKNM